MAYITLTVIADDPFRYAMWVKSCFCFLDGSGTLGISESFYVNEMAVIFNHEKEVAFIPFNQIIVYYLPWTITNLVWYDEFSWI